MGSRTMPYVCPHGVEVDAGDFGPCQDCETHGDDECPNFTPCSQCEAAAEKWHMDWALEQLAAAGFVVVACPSGGRVVVSRESKPCEPCGGAGQWYHQDTYDAVSCESCGGSGVVEATTIHGLAEVRLGWIDEDGAERPLHPFAVERMLGDETLYRLEQVALPEDGQ